MAAALSRVYAGLCRRDRLTSKECPFWLDSLFCVSGVDEQEGYIAQDDDPGIVVPVCPYDLTQDQDDAVQNILGFYANDENGTATYFAVREYLRATF
jgi:hypothetical protein